MRAFLLACLVALILAIGAAYVLESYPNTPSAVYGTPAVRV